MERSKTRRRSVKEATSEVIAEAKIRIISVSTSISEMLSSVGNFRFTKTLNEQGEHTEGDKDLIERKNNLILEKKGAMLLTNPHGPTTSTDGFKLTLNKQKMFSK